jgi:hypothetical protein
MAEGEDLGYFVALIFWVISPRARVRSTSRESFGVAGRTQLLGREASQASQSVEWRQLLFTRFCAHARAACLVGNGLTGWLAGILCLPFV